MFTPSRVFAGALAAVPLAALLVVAAPGGEAHALTCKSYKVTTNFQGFGRNTKVAKRNARIKWRALVRVKPSLGWAWSDWGKAKDRKYTCKNAGTLGRRKCHATARPCK